MHSTRENFWEKTHSNEVVNELFESLCSKYQHNLEKPIKGSYFIFDTVQLLYYKCHKVNFTCGGSYIDSPGWIKKKKQQ